MEDSFLARARGWLNTGTGRWVTISLGLLLVGGAAAMFFVGGSGTKADAIRAKGKRVLYYCESCGATGEMRIPWNATFPLVCPKCGKRQAVLGYRCRKCKKITKMTEGEEIPCVHCGYVNRNLMAGGDPRR